jgi:predicted NBD/HSP70 family sugar kinase
MTLRCEVIDSCTRPEISEMNLESIVELTGQCCEALMADHGVKWEDVQGICISTSGVVIREANRVRYNSLFPEWGKDIPLAEMVAKRLDTKALIITENVGKVCGSAFLRDHSVDNARVAAVFSRWGGIVASLMDNGRIVGGKDSLIGEIGHMIIEPDDGEACGCGSRGCFERQVSVERLRAMAAKWQGDFPESPLAKMLEADFTIQKVFELSQAGDALARRLSDYAAHHFAIAMRNLALLFNPDWVVFQGDYADADEHFLECFYRELRQFRYFNDAPGTDNPFVLRTDKRSIADLTTIGAYTLLIDRLFSSENTIQ